LLLALDQSGDWSGPAGPNNVGLESGLVANHGRLAGQIKERLAHKVDEDKEEVAPLAVVHFLVCVVPVKHVCVGELRVGHVREPVELCQKLDKVLARCWVEVAEEAGEGSLGVCKAKLDE
jgi:hypothetical protein